MKRIRGAAVALAAALVAASTPAAAVDYVNAVELTTASASSTIYYFHKAQSGTTSAFANAQECQNWSVFNGGSAKVTVRIYTSAAPTYLPPFSDSDWTKDYVSLPIQAGAGLTFLDVPFIGYNLETAPTAGSFSIVGWNDD